MPQLITDVPGKNNSLLKAVNASHKSKFAALSDTGNCDRHQIILYPEFCALLVPKDNSG
jgi:hypothetical protein